MRTIFKNALENVKTNKIRVAIAMVWIVLGITSVVVVSSIGNGISSQNERIRENPSYRKSTITFQPSYDDSIDASFYQPFTQEDIDMVSLIKGVQLVVPKYGDTTIDTSYGTVLNNNEYGRSKFIQYEDDTKINVKYGRNFSLEDLERDTIILDYNVAWRLFNEIPESAVGNSVEVNSKLYEVIGVTENTEKIKDNKQEGYKEPECYFPKEALEEMGSGLITNSDITGLEITVAKGYDTTILVSEIVEKINKIKGEKEGEERYYQTGSSDEGSELLYMQFMIDRFTGVLTSVSLFIGGIGIMNIMYMSVSERQREIGIRRAIGATPKDILLQFLIETIVITVLGGLLGAIVGTFASNYASGYLGIKAIPDGITYVKAIATSIAMGAVFGLIPASRAAKLDPIKAIQG